jgi:hypothetical protein
MVPSSGYSLSRYDFGHGNAIDVVSMKYLEHDVQLFTDDDRKIVERRQNRLQLKIFKIFG